MRVRRDIASVPARSAAETWQAIIALVTGPDSVEPEQLHAARSIMESIIADEHPASVPIILKGAGPRVLIYCLYGEDAMEAGLSVDSLASNPTGGDWRMTAPSEEGDVSWMNRSLSKKAPRISVHDVNDTPTDEASEPKAEETLAIDWGALGKS